MIKLHYTTQIKASAKHVWDTMLNDETYRKWTTAFGEGCYYEGKWEVGSKMLFLAQDAAGNTGGMVSTIAEVRPYEFVSIKHLGIVKNGIEDTTSPEVQTWANAFENYTFKELNGGTELTVDLDSDEDNAKMFEDAWPKALEKLKELAEAQ